LIGIRVALTVAACLGGACAGARGAAAAPHWRITRLAAPAHGPSSYAEPGIAIGRTGAVLVDAATANTGAPPTFWLSRTNGRTWPIGRDDDLSGAGAGDADGAIGRDGYLYALNLGYNNPPAQPSNPTVLVDRSRDGRTWSGPAAFPPPHGEDQPDRPWLVVDPRHPARVEVVHSEVGGNIVAWRSSDHGVRFSGPYPVSGGANSQAALALSSRPLFDPRDDRRVFMLYETGTGLGVVDLLPIGAPLWEFPVSQLWLATSADGGLTWSNRKVLDTATATGALRGATLAHLLVASTVDTRGRLYAAISARPAGSETTSLYLLHSATHGRSWSVPAAIATSLSSNVMPALAVSRGGAVAYLSWYGSPATDFRSPSARWSEMFAESRHPLAAHPRFAVSQVSGAAPVHVGGIDAAGAPGSELGANWGLRDFQSIAVDPCGQPHVVWADDVSPSTYTATFRALCRRR
jgi:hypothetical protein